MMKLLFWRFWFWFLDLHLARGAAFGYLVFYRHPSSDGAFVFIVYFFSLAWRVCTSWHMALGTKELVSLFSSLFEQKQTQMKVLNSYIITTKQRNKILCILPHDDIHCVDFLTSLHVFMALGDGYVKQTAMDDESCITAVRATREICSYTTASYFTASHSRRKQLESSQKMIEW